MALIKDDKYYKIDLKTSLVNKNGISCIIANYNSKEDRELEKQRLQDFINYAPRMKEIIDEYTAGIAENPFQYTYRDFRALELFKKLYDFASKGENALTKSTRGIFLGDLETEEIFKFIIKKFDFPSDWYYHPVEVFYTIVNCADYNHENLDLETLYPLLKSHFYGKNNEDTTDLVEDDL